MHSQSKSKLLSAPLEVRREIYSHLNIDNQIHLFLHEGKLRMSACLEPSLGDNTHDGRERQDEDGRGYRDPQWARRLASAWGPHWECEENAFLDVFDLITETSAIIITDMDALDGLTTGQYKLEANSNCHWNVWEHMQCRIKSLNIALRLPLAFYRALEEIESRDPITVTSSITTVASMSCTWMRIWPSIFGLQQLQSLYIWLDHDDPSSWSVVKEKLILDYVFTNLEQQMQVRSSIIDFPQLNVVFNLPKLHPGIAKAETHFAEATSPPPFKIERRYRQRYHCNTSDDGTLSVKQNSDFPIMHEIAEFYADESLGDLVMTFEESEDMEKNMWLRGEDVEQEIREIMSLNGFHVCY
ncbi:hypothetical protein DL98DRAFT_602220 [Cadophora sp. DSE1049]|nr:hypothetical protein DL98DRAFT_602220 [Cadophora sp. DSE1049]